MEELFATRGRIRDEVSKMKENYFTRKKLCKNFEERFKTV